MSKPNTKERIAMLLQGSAGMSPSQASDVAADIVEAMPSLAENEHLREIISSDAGKWLDQRVLALRMAARAMDAEGMYEWAIGERDKARDEVAQISIKAAELEGEVAWLRGQPERAGEEARQPRALPDWLSDVERLAKNIYYTTGVDGLRWDLLDDEERNRYRNMARKLIRYLPPSEAPVVCPYCGALEGRHELIHVRNGGGGGHNKQCPRAGHDDAPDDAQHVCLRDD